MRRCAGLSVSKSIAIKKSGFLMTSSYVLSDALYPLAFFSLLLL